MTCDREISIAFLRSGTVTIVVAHPDDEVLGCGALLSGLRDVTIAHVTDGAPADPDVARQSGFASPAAYARARRSEAERALSFVDIGPDRMVALGIVDQQASLCMAAIAKALMPMIDASDVVLTHAFEGGHSDHDAVALAVHAARRLGQKRATLVEMPFYHAGPYGWARQVFLPHADAGPERSFRVEGPQRALKQRMVEAHRTQAAVLRDFDIEIERFRRAPAYDFTALPHAGPLLYEEHDWNLSGSLWIERASAALAELDLR